ncbi:uncharacterized protein FFB14_04094 [Fusarium fujikuroi]|nr:uncharacterized protein FFB14_04094 [Fusarium fujikuroi]
MQVFTGNGHSNRDHVTPEYPSSVSQKRKTTSESASKTTTEDLARYESDIAKMVPLTGVSGSDDQKDFSCERFGTFRKQSLKQDLKDTPTCHDLALFIRYTSGKVKGQSDDGATQHEYVPVVNDWSQGWSLLDSTTENYLLPTYFT